MVASGEFVGTERRAHWERIYQQKQPNEVSWYQSDPTLSVTLVEAAGVLPDDPIIDVGGGASLLVDRLLERGFRDLTVLDIADTALAHVRLRLGAASGIALIRADVTQFASPRKYALWHDRAVFHFLTDPIDRRAYVAALTVALRPRAHVIIATFALDGPSRCSGLDVARYDPEGLASQLGSGFQLLRVEQEQHITPAKRVQHFQYCLFRADAS